MHGVALLPCLEESSLVALLASPLSRGVLLTAGTVLHVAGGGGGGMGRREGERKGGREGEREGRREGER